MRTKTILACITTVILLSLSACSSASVAPETETCFFRWNQESEIDVSGFLTVNLESNPTTGYSWELIRISDKTVLENVGHGYVEPEAGAPLGTGGEEAWTFKALKRGKSSVAMEYRRPGEQGVEPEQVFILTVVVK